MQTHEGTVRKIGTMFLLTSTLSLAGVAALAQKPAIIAHIAVQQKIVQDAGDRRGVRFISTHVSNVDSIRRSITGEGMFRRKGKSPQHFSYVVDVNNVKKIATRVNYNIH